MVFKYTKEFIDVLKDAEEIAKELKHYKVGTDHILYAILNKKIYDDDVFDNEININEYLSKMIENNTFEEVQSADVAEKDDSKYTYEAINILTVTAYDLALYYEKLKIDTGLVLLSILSNRFCRAYVLLNKLNADIATLYGRLFIAYGKNMSDKVFNNDKKEMATANNVEQVSVIDQLCEDMIELVAEKKLDPLVGREEELDRVIQILARKTKNNPCLIGEAGVGKTAIVHGLAQRIYEGNVPFSLMSARLLRLDMTALVAGTRYRGDLEERVQNLIKELDYDNIILFIDEIHTMVGAGKAEGTSDMANMLKPVLANGKLSVIGTTTHEEYRKNIEKDPALVRRFSPVRVNEPSVDEAIEILNGLRESYENYYSIKISDEAISSAVKLSKRYINDRNLPDKAIDLIDEAAAKKVVNIMGPDSSVSIKMLGIELINRKITSAEMNEDVANIVELEELLEKEKKELDYMLAQDIPELKGVTLNSEDIERTLSMLTGIKMERIGNSEAKRLANLENEIHERIIAQNHAVSAVSKAVRRGRSGIKDPNKPIGSFLFLGPTGVGKTELCKALASSVYGDEKSLIRIDMSEFMEGHSVSKLIGSPPGYIGHDDGGQLTKAVKINPYSIVLFDEIEKANNEVFNIFLQILDDGFLTDSNGNKIDFRNTIVIMTSNIGAARLVEQKNMGFLADNSSIKDYNMMREIVLEEVKNSLKPELINRIDEIIVFKQLSDEELLKIVDILLKSLFDRLKKDMKISARINKGVKEFIAQKGNDKKYGARPLKRAVQRYVEDKLASMIVSGDIKEGSSISLNIKNDDIQIKVTRS